MRTLRNRSRFLDAARGRKVSGRFFTLQARRVADDDPGIGFTVTKRTGNSPERNRIKRRLRAVVATCQNGLRPQHDYVLIGRRSVLSASFPALTEAFGRAVTQLHAGQPAQ